jgi:mono/diheme cytochrome c family protein
MSADNIERGRQIFLVADCAGCHSPHDPKRYDFPPVEGKLVSGRLFPEKSLPGTIYAANLTPDKQTGLGNWTDGEKIRAIREGISRDGHMLFPLMPYTNFRYLSDNDVQALVAYLNSLPAVNNPLGQTKINFPVSLMIKGVPRPVKGPVQDPDRLNKQLYGEYLVTIGSCQTCHTPFEKGRLDLSKSFAGGRRFEMEGAVVVSANITPSRQTGIGDWDLDRFVKRFHMHREHAGKPIPATDPQEFTLMPWDELSELSAQDLEAIYTYLRTLPAVENKVVVHPGSATRI